MSLSPSGPDSSQQILTFLQDCKENPDDDTPRLVFADWLEERDDPRGSLIRVQCQKKHTSHLDARWAELNAQEQALLAAHSQVWLASLQNLPGSLSFHRGLIRLTIRQEENLQHLAHYQGSPYALAWLEEVRLSLAGLPQLLKGNRSVLEAFTSLDLSGSPSPYLNPDNFSFGIGSRTVWPVCHDLRHLRRLSLSGQSLDSDSVRGLAHSSLDSLRELELSSIQLNRLGLEALAEADWLPRLTSLNLESNPLCHGLPALLPVLSSSRLHRLILARCSLAIDKSLEPLAESALFSRLTWLDLEGNNLRAAGVRALARLQKPGRLTYLNLSNNGLDDEAVVALASSPLLAQVQTLDLKNNSVGRRGAEALANSPFLGQLAHLDLSYNRLESTPLSLWTTSLRLPSLRILHLGNNRIDDQALEGLSRQPVRAPLQTLILRRNHISDQGLAQLLASPLAEQLLILDLSSNQIRPGGARLVAEATSLGRLRVLNLDNNEIGDAGALALACSPSLQHLTQLNTRGNRILHGGLDTLQNRFGPRVDV